ncbi:S41 family peptidase [Sphingomonas sp. BN140010]|uniref:S41 family peptidase n=1 Tax=Sphingomonas arvum TaxID=2992113 RepID=A0ABT3JFY5_9SPHN|nr:S41 family peptidase [Sphingomonas sp. BN140010]MCW3797992.1 S41 family peptidase [Sphingomonas sp. BN140010]
MRRSTVGLQLLCACAAISSFGPGSRALAQAAPAAETITAGSGGTLAKGVAADVVRDVIAAVRRNYVHPERVAAITARLQAGLASGRYASTSAHELVDRMSVDLKESSGNDGHMYIYFNPAEAAARAKASPKDGDPEENAAFFREQMRVANHGISELKILPGNVRYMNISQWLWDPQSSPRAYDDAIRFLKDGDAIIIDISRNGGGSAEAVEYLVSHFVEPGRKLMTFRDGPSNVEEAFSQKVGDHLDGKPLFVLTSSRSASASEEFASHVRNFKLGTLVGKTTGGAGNPNSLFPVAHGFVASISTGLAIHPVTGKGWEGVGVAPHREVEPARALDVAHAEALKMRLASAKPSERPQLEWLIAALSDGTTAATAGAAELHSFAGLYTGDRRVSERAGRLYWQRGDGAEVELVPLGGTRFAVGDRFGSRVEFGTCGELTVTRPGSAPEKLSRQSQLSSR